MTNRREELEKTRTEKQARLTELERQHDAIPEQVRRSSEEKSQQIQQWQDFLTQTTTYLFLILVIIFICKGLSRFFTQDQQK